MLHPLCNVIMPLWRNAGAKALGERRKGRLFRLSICQFYWHHLLRLPRFTGDIIWLFIQCMIRNACTVLVVPRNCWKRFTVYRTILWVISCEAFFLYIIGNCLSDFFLWDLAVVRIFPEWVTSREQALSPAVGLQPSATGQACFGMAILSFLIKVVPVWLSRYCLVTPRGGDDGFHWIVKK